MKVKDLISKLENADPEQEVFAAPLIYLPILQPNSNSGILSDDEVQKIATPFERYPIGQVGLMTDLVNGVDKSKQYVFLGYETNEKSDEQSNTLTTPEFIN